MKSVYFPLNKGDALSQMYRPTEGNVQRTLSNLKASFTTSIDSLFIMFPFKGRFLCFL